MSRPDARPTAEDAVDPPTDREERSAASAVTSVLFKVAPGVLGVACIVVVAR
jgi:hypothetical protein